MSGIPWIFGLRVFGLGRILMINFEWRVNKQQQQQTQRRQHKLKKNHISNNNNTNKNPNLTNNTISNRALFSPFSSHQSLRLSYHQTLKPHLKDGEQKNTNKPLIKTRIFLNSINLFYNIFLRRLFLVPIVF